MFWLFSSKWHQMKLLIIFILISPLQTSSKFHFVFFWSILFPPGPFQMNGNLNKNICLRRMINIFSNGNEKRIYFSSFFSSLFIYSSHRLRWKWFLSLSQHFQTPFGKDSSQQNHNEREDFPELEYYFSKEKNNAQRRNKSLRFLLFPLIFHAILVISYNQPIFSRNASWNPNAITFAGERVVGNSPHGLFVDINNTFYVACLHFNEVKVWYEGNASLIKSFKR